MIAVFLPEAEQEMFESARYYEFHAEGLGVDFLSETERTVTAIKESPTAWPIVEGKLRRRLVRRFPFGILYHIDPTEIVIVAVAHLSRKPGFWRGRI